MSASDIGGLVVFSSFGLWWAIAPHSVVRFYTRFHKGSAVRLQPEARSFRIVRIVGLLWVVLVVTVYFFGR
jgi:hypothetical protein